jgi:hypothetical protein
MTDLISLKGCIDLHIHTGPDRYRRIWSDIETVEMALQYGMKAIVLKNHVESTVGRAYHASKIYTDVQVFGGLILNKFVGGINPVAVEEALKMGAKIIWMPTLHSAHHMQVIGTSATLALDKPPITEKEKVRAGWHEKEGISVLEDGKLKKEVKETLEIISEYDAICSTAHLSRDEIMKIAEFSRSIGFRKLLIAHPFFRVPALGIEDLKKLVALGATPEFCAAISLGFHRYSSVEKVKEAVDALGPEHCILSSDGGQTYNPIFPELLRIFAQTLHDRGVPKEHLNIMMRKNQETLLNIE